LTICETITISQTESFFISNKRFESEPLVQFFIVISSNQDFSSGSLKFQ